MPEMVLTENGDFEGRYYSQFKTHNDHVLRVIDSTLAYPPSVWLESMDGEPMHLTVQHAKTLIRILQRFVDNETVKSE